MIYELWEMITDINYAEPLFLIEKSTNFNKIYSLYVETIRLKPCAIFIKLENK